MSTLISLKKDCDLNGCFWQSWLFLAQSVCFIKAHIGIIWSSSSLKWEGQTSTEICAHTLPLSLYLIVFLSFGKNAHGGKVTAAFLGIEIWWGPGEKSLMWNNFLTKTRLSLKNHSPRYDTDKTELFFAQSSFRRRKGLEQILQRLFDSNWAEDTK